MNKPELKVGDAVQWMEITTRDRESPSLHRTKLDRADDEGENLKQTIKEPDAPFCGCID